MSVSVRPWGSAHGVEVSLYTITNAAGASLQLTNLGATAVSLVMPAPSGQLADVILGFDSAQDYLATPTYFGATVGRFGNRIRRGRFEIDGKTYSASCNEGPNSLHGGALGFDKKLWIAETPEQENKVRFHLQSPDDDEGFPGNLHVTSTYSLTDDNTVCVEMSATTDKPTLCNIVHHSYFNLAGHDSGDILSQELEIHSDFYTPVDDELIITGEVLRVDETAFDFRSPRAIGARIEEVTNAGAGRVTGSESGGYDHNWCLRGEPRRLRPVLSARDPKSGRGFTLSTNQPGVHFYTGGYLNSSIIGKGGKPYCRYAGFTLETQTFPNSPNLSHVPQARLDPGEIYAHVMQFQFFR
jgi:aldose 1-epimerase